MVRILLSSLLVFLFVMVPAIQAQYKLPWCDYYQHDTKRPMPPIKKVGPFGKSIPPPADATILFNGNDMSKWKDFKSGGASKWKLENGEMVCSGDGLVTKDSFGNVQVHAEWLAPTGYKGPWYYAGNNGVTMMAQFEIQTFDSYEYKIKELNYADGICSAIYGQTPPLYNACRPAGEWQTFDIYFTAPIFKNGKLEKEAFITMWHNDVQVHKDQKIYGTTGHNRVPDYKDVKGPTGPILLPGHGDCKVRFRNIWTRKFNPDSGITSTPDFGRQMEYSPKNSSLEQFSINAAPDGHVLKVNSDGSWTARLIDLQGKQVFKTIRGNKDAEYSLKGLPCKAFLIDMTTARGHHISKVALPQL